MIYLYGMTKLPVITKAELVSLYLSQKLSTYKIANIYHCHPAQIRTLLKDSGIQRRSRRDAMLIDRGIIISKQELIKLYLNRDYSVYKIADLYKCYASTICKKLKENNIAIKPPREQVRVSKEKLITLYRIRKLSTYKIAKIVGCTVKTIVKKMDKFGINRRENKKVPIDKKSLLNLYQTRRYSLKKIGSIYGITPSAVFRKFQKNHIKLRNSWETNTKYKKKPFTGTNQEKAYLIGFRLGDLGVRQQSKLTQTIIVGCNTTKKEQVRLIETLFSKYSHVWVSRPNNIGVICTSVLLDPSFSFLIPKNDFIETWILQNHLYTASFTAGYTDAEGNIGVYDKRARYRLGSYDKGILKQIDAWFRKNGIRSILRLDREKKKGQNQDFWRITVNQAKSLLKIYKLVFPYMKHGKRVSDFTKAKQNIDLRLQNGTIRI